MTAEAMDLAALKSWHAAFEYPVGTTRQIEQRLRADIVSNRGRLRTLVGYIGLILRSGMLTLMSRYQGQLPRSFEHRRENHSSRWINARGGGLVVKAESQLQLGCYQQEDPRSRTVEAGGGE